ncbi:MAG: RdgB/HAM1 family non-canonical purine NTP pyrophosphatase, partial [Bacteroidia bacterium]
PMELVLATHNPNKVKEIQSKLSHSFTLKSLSDIGFDKEIPEDFDTLRQNAEQKADTIYKAIGKSCFADDTGLLVNALNGAPGVYSARYAGEHCNSNDNINKLLKKLDGVGNRSAHFETVICLILNNKKYFFEGRAEGVITLERSGADGFGYDPIFLPNGYTQTFAEMSMNQKNRISHRAKAFTKLLAFIDNLKL